MYECSGSQSFRTTNGIESGPDAFHKSRFVVTIVTILGVWKYFLFQISPRRDRCKCKEIPKSSRLELLEKLLVNNFALSDAEDSTSWSLNRGGIADLPLLGTLLAICQNSQEPRLWEVMVSFVLVAYANLGPLRALLQQLLACLNFTIHSKDLFCWYKRKK